MNDKKSFLKNRVKGFYIKSSGKYGKNRLKGGKGKTALRGDNGKEQGDLS